MSSEHPGHVEATSSTGVSPPMPGGLLTAEEAAQWLNVTRSWLLAEAREDRVPHVRLGKYVRFHPTALAAWVAGQMRGMP